MVKSSPEGADYVVVGAGSAGGAIAARLSENPDIKVILLEAGGRDNDMLIRMPAAVGLLVLSQRHNWNYWTTPQRALGDRRITMPRGKVLGGSSSINGMVYIRGHALDYERWVDEGATGWSYSEVLPYFKRLEDHRDRRDAYHGQGGPVQVVTAKAEGRLRQAFVAAGVEAGYGRTDDVNGFRQEGFGPYDMNVENGRRASSAYAYLRKARNRPNLIVRTHSEVMKIVIENGRATGVDVLVDGSLRRIHADREVIVSAGSINSPKLLKLSGIGPAGELRSHGIDIVADHPDVGENLQDHVETHLQYRCPKPITLHQDHKTLPMAMIGARWLLFKTGKGASNQYEVGGFIRSDAGVRHPDIQFHFVPIAYTDRDKRLVTEDGFRIHVGPMRSQSRGSVKLASPDPRADPLIDIGHMKLERDWIEMRKSIELTREIVAQKAFDGLRTDELSPGTQANDRASIDGFIRDTALTAYHPSGTCRMGKDVRAVVDPQCRVQGIEGLRVADASIMPSIVSGNLNIPTMMIGEKASDMILGRTLPADADARFYEPATWRTAQR